MKKKMAVCLFMILALLANCTKQQLRTAPQTMPGDGKQAPIASPEQQQSPGNQKKFMFNNAEVIGYLDNPTPVYILDADASPASNPFRGFCRYAPAGQFSTEEYDRIYENPFLETVNNPVSTFSIDVDAASYANIRRFIDQSRMPPSDAVRIEEMINYFSYDYRTPAEGMPVALHSEVSECPWETEHLILKVGLCSREIDVKDLPPSNIVFLLDVSGSMADYNKLPLVKRAMRLLVNELRSQDRISIVVYAGAAGLVLRPTSGHEKRRILKAIDDLEAGGSTAGGQGIELAYRIARENFISGGNNRVVLATDGDFNIGISSDAELVRLIERRRNDGVFLTVLGFGEGNLKDSKMEKLADKGNGNYAYIDNIVEAKKVFVKELGATLFAVAKDVKLQIEFNPTKVYKYRLIGYENRFLRREDFDNDTVDAGDLGAGHQVTALYEVVPTGSHGIEGDTLRYQETVIKGNSFSNDELGFMKLRYKKPDEEMSHLIQEPIIDKNKQATPSTDLQFACAVAAFGMLLRQSEHSGKADYNMVLEMARDSKGRDSEGYRSEFISIVEKEQLLSNSREEKEAD